jgi:hypothetical protein
MENVLRSAPAGTFMSAQSPGPGSTMASVSRTIRNSVPGGYSFVSSSAFRNAK